MQLRAWELLTNRLGRVDFMSEIGLVQAVLVMKEVYKMSKRNA